MGSGGSKPPPTSVRAYPGSNRNNRSDTDNNAAPEYRGPRSSEALSDDTRAGGSSEGGDISTPPAADKPDVVIEDDVLRRLHEDRDVILDDGEPIGTNPKPKPLLTNRCTNKQQSEMGRKVRNMDCRSNHSNRTPHVTERPRVTPGELWTDPDFTKEIAMRGLGDEVKWCRPKEFLERPCLYVDGTCRYDVEQGAAGTCWFLSILSSLGDKPEYLGQIIPDDAYNIETTEYDGIFHCRFWQFGRWEDVYIDDYLPIQYGKQWGARSRTDKNEMWISLMEKAFAKFHGSYKDCWGGVAGRAFVALTGGVAELTELDNVNPKEFYRRMKNSLLTGSILACSIPEDGGNLMGLTGKHAYSITGVCKVPYRDKYQSLVRIRNPWGGSVGEWKGAWSDGSKEWNDVSEAHKSEINVSGAADGEFWMSLLDFCQYFGSVSVCNFTPDIDEDGKPDDLSNVWSVFGEWHGETAASWAENRMKNPKYVVTIPKKGCNKKGEMPVAIQFIQDRKDRMSTEDQLNIRTDIYKLDKETSNDGKTCWLLRDVTKFTTYWGAYTMTYRYHLTPGRYVLMPHYSQPAGAEKEFILRIFTQVEIECSESPENLACFVSTLTETFEYDGNTQDTSVMEHMFGTWKAGKNAGGQMAHHSVEKNPQYSITVRGTGTPQPVSIALLQEKTTDVIPIGLRMFKRDHTNMPLATHWLYRHPSPNNIENQPYVFMNHYETKTSYMLPGGDYVILIHTNNPDEEARYFLSVATKRPALCKGFNVCT